VKAALVAAQRRGLTFDKAVEKCLACQAGRLQERQAPPAMGKHPCRLCHPELGKMLVQDITTQDVLRVLQPLWMDKTETASRLRGRIEAVLSWATVAGHRTGDNPARWAGNLKELLPPPSKVANEGNHPALALDDAPAGLPPCRPAKGSARGRWSLLALTATRSQEVRGRAWDEIDMDKALWIIPGARMKMGKEHRVPLPARAVALLKALPRLEATRWCFRRRAAGIVRHDPFGDHEADARSRGCQGGQGSLTARPSAQPCRMACAARSAIGWPSARPIPATWPRSPLRTVSATRWRPAIGAAT
jgi:hypothetical protein